MENGFLAQDDEENNIFIPNIAHYYIEILKQDQDSQADEGEIGRIVVTDYYNYAQPMIRYDTGDVGAWVKTKSGKGGIGKFGGRVVDLIYDFEGNPVSPHAVTRAMAKYYGIEQYQFAQIGTARYEMRLNTMGTAILEDELRQDIIKIVGEEANISIKYYDEIPALASGKRRYIVNEMGNR
jgi:phenylacetate-CoA ligase